MKDWGYYCLRWFEHFVSLWYISSILYVKCAFKKKQTYVTALTGVFYYKMNTCVYKAKKIQITLDLKIGSEGSDFFWFFHFLKLKMCLENRSWRVKLLFNRNIRPKCTMKWFTAFWLALFTHSDWNCPKSRRESV
jgi:hypothetical protein